MKNLLSLTIIGILSTSVSANDKLEAFSLYNSGNFSAAEAKLLKLARENPADAEINFHLGRAALENKNYDTAIAAFDRVLIVNPLHARTRLEIARLYYERGYYTLSLHELDSVLAGKLPSDVRKSVQEFRDKVAYIVNRHHVSGTIMLGIEHDNNVNNDIGSKSFTIPSINIPIDGKTENSDYASFQGVFLNYKYDIGDFGGFFIESGLDAYNKSYFDASANNITLGAANTALVYATNSYKISMPLNYAKVYLGSESYVDTFGIGLNAKYAFGTNAIGEAGISARKNSYANANRLRDSDEMGAYAGVQFALGQERPYTLSMYITGRDTYAKHNTRTDVSQRELALKSEIGRELVAKLRANIAYTRKSNDYDDTDTLFLSKRKDRENRYDLTLSYEIAKRQVVSIGASRINRDSNHAPFTYDKNLLSTHYMFSF